MQYILATYALEKSDRLFMKSMIDMANKKFGLKWCLDDINGQVTVVDIDTQEGRTFWQTNHAQKTLIAYAQYNNCQAAYFLEKPLKVQLVTELLRRLSESLSPVSKIPNNVVVPELTPSATTTSGYQPDGYLAGLLKNIVKAGTPCTLQLSGAPALHVVPEDQMCYTVEMDLSENSPAQNKLMKTPSDFFSKSLINEDKLNLVREDFHAIDINAFIWVSTLQTSNGNLLTGHSLTLPVRLKEWPNFSILPYDPTHMQLAAFMSKNIASIPRISANTRQMMPHVINFYNACVMLDLVSIDKLNKESSEITKTISTEKKGLFQNILQRLMR